MLDAELPESLGLAAAGAALLFAGGFAAGAFEAALFAGVTPLAGAAFAGAFPFVDAALPFAGVDPGGVCAGVIAGLLAEFCPSGVLAGEDAVSAGGAFASVGARIQPGESAALPAEIAESHCQSKGDENQNVFAGAAVVMFSFVVEQVVEISRTRIVMRIGAQARTLARRRVIQSEE